MSSSAGETYLELVKQLARTLAARHIPYAFSGALANAVWGVPRATKDVDLLISVPRIALPETVQCLLALGCTGSVDEALVSSREEYVMRLKYQGIEVEIFLPYLPFHQDVLRRRVSHEVDGIPVYFVTAEDLILLKFLFHRAKDVADIQTLLAVRAGRLDTAYLTSTLKRLLPPDDPRHQELTRWSQGLMT